jgi:guanylate kinase
VGAGTIKERFPGALMILLDAPSREVQEQRMIGRGDPPEKIAARLARSDAEAEHALSLGSNWVVNDDLDTTVDKVQRIIEEHRAANP